MHYVKSFNINGVDTKQVACIELRGKPNAATEGAVGVLGIDVTSPTRDVYKCVAVNGAIYTWELLSSGMSIISSTNASKGASKVNFEYASLLTPSGYILKAGDLIIDKGGYLYQVTALGNSSCEAKYTGTQLALNMVARGISKFEVALSEGRGTVNLDENSLYSITTSAYQSAIMEVKSEGTSGSSMYTLADGTSAMLTYDKDTNELVEYSFVNGELVAGGEWSSFRVSFYKMGDTMENVDSFLSDIETEINKLINAKIVQTTGDSENAVMSQKAMTGSLGKITFKASDLAWEQGSASVSNFEPSTTRIIAEWIQIGRNKEVKITATLGYDVACLSYDENKTGIATTGWAMGKGIDTTLTANARYIRVLVRHTDNSDITPDEDTGARITVSLSSLNVDNEIPEISEIFEVSQEIGDSESKVMSQKAVTDELYAKIPLIWEAGAISGENGLDRNNAEAGDNSRCRTVGYLDIRIIYSITTIANLPNKPIEAQYKALFLYDEDRKFIRTLNMPANVTWYNADICALADNVKYIRIRSNYAETIETVDGSIAVLKNKFLELACEQLNQYSDELIGKMYGSFGGFGAIAPPNLWKEVPYPNIDTATNSITFKHHTAVIDPRLPMGHMVFADDNPSYAKCTVSLEVKKDDGTVDTNSAKCVWLNIPTNALFVTTPQTIESRVDYRENILLVLCRGASDGTYRHAFGSCPITIDGKLTTIYGDDNTDSEEASVEIVQTTGDSESKVMSQKAVTQALSTLSDAKANTITTQSAVFLGEADKEYVVTWENIGSSNLRLTIPHYLRIRGGNFKYGHNVSNWAESIDTSLEGKYTIDGTALTIDIERYGSRLVFNTDSKKLFVRSTLESVNNPNDIILMVNGYGTPCGGLLMYNIDLGRIKALEDKAKNIQPSINEATQEKIMQFATLFNNTENVEPFLFFTDPHLTSFRGDGWRAEFNEYMNSLANVYNEAPVERVFCGGDWLGNEEFPSDAFYRLGLIDSTMRKNFKYYHLMVGNHDTNYQGCLDENSERYTGKISNRTIANLWARNTKTLYYKVESRQTDFYILDSNAPTNDTNGVYDTEYMEEQLKWLAQELNKNTRDNIAIMSHIIMSTNGTIDTAVQNLADIIGAFNSRSSVVIGGETFNFASASGKIRYCMCGHKHADGIYVMGGVPVVMTTQMREGGVPTYDLCLANYDTNTLHLVRIGTGEDRTITI